MFLQTNADKMQTSSGRCRLCHSLAERELDDVDAALHDKRQDDTIANLAPAGLRFRLFLGCCTEAVNSIFDDRDDLAQARSRLYL